MVGGAVRHLRILWWSGESGADFAAVCSRDSLSTSIGTYDISAEFGYGCCGISPFDEDYANEIAAQPWYGNESLAAEFALKLGDQLGFPNSFTGGCGLGESWPPCGDVAPFFRLGHMFTHQMIALGLLQDGSVVTFLDEGFTNEYWAVARQVTSVPEPGTLPLVAAGILGLALLRRHGGSNSRTRPQPC